DVCQRSVRFDDYLYMKTLVLSGKEAIEKGAELIKQGQIVVFPTETVYGLGASAFDINAIKQIFVAKGRPMDNPLIAHVGAKEQIAPLVASISVEAQKVIDKFMPGPITIILKKSDLIDKVITAGLDTVGIRMPQSAIAREFINACGVPIVAPSANTSTRISPTKASHVFDDMQGRIPLIIDGGDCEVGIESTIVDMSVDMPTVLRPGAITSQMLAEVLGQVATFKGQVVVAKAPGMKYKHYAPKCKMVVGQSFEHIIAEYDKQLASGVNPIILCKTDMAAMLERRRHIDVGQSGEEVTRNIYGAMHSAEECSDYIICEDFGQDGVCLSVMNRVNKASAGERV
ncbi:MAG: L-threonylcarbamoyladenylate synthase, partial [Clostridia bacterium]